MVRQGELRLGSAWAVLSLLSALALVVAGCGTGSSVLPGGGGDGDESGAQDVGGGLAVRAINIGSLKTVTTTDEGRVYTTLGGTQITYLRATHQVKGDLIAYAQSGLGYGGLATFAASDPPAVGGPESLIGSGFGEPSWAPNGARLYATRGTSVYRLSYDGTGISGPLFEGFGPTWSPDGAYVYYSRGSLPSDAELYRRGVSSGPEEQLTDNAANDWWPQVSPDGSRIVFVTDPDGDYDIAVQNASGINSGRVVIDYDMADNYPAWSPDGRRIVFSSFRDGDEEIYVMDPDGSNVVQLTNNNVVDHMPSYSPDGRRIVFRSGRDVPSSGELYQMDVDGSDVLRLTNSMGTIEYYPRWSPATLAHPRVYVSNTASDRGFNPPFGTGIDAAILVRNQTPQATPDTDCVAFDVLPSGQTITLTRLDQPGVVYEVSATANFFRIWEDRQAGNPPLTWIGNTPAPISSNTIRNLVLTFDPTTGRLTDAMPVAGRGEPSGRVHREGDTLTWVPAG